MVLHLLAALALFHDVKTVAVSGKPDALIAADFNGDGSIDLAAGCDHAVAILLGDGNGGFRESARLAVPGQPSELAAADFDRDGNADIAIADHDTFGLWLLRGDGKGGLARMGFTRVQRTGRPHTHGLLAGDWNGDGKPDALHFNVDENSAVPLFGDGRGELSASGGARLALQSPNNPLLADFNRDGILDFASAGINQGKLEIQLGDGKGGFARAPGSPLAVHARPFYVAAGDLNGDGLLDLAATHDDDPVLTLLLGDGKGGFRAAPGSPLRMPAQAYGIAILRGGRVAAVTGSHFHLLWPDGAAPESIAKLAKGGWRMAVADFNGDGMPDLASASPEAGAISILLLITSASRP